MEPLLENRVLAYVADARPFLRVTDVIAAAHEWGVGELDVRECIWTLIKGGQIELTPDRRLRFNGPIVR